MSLPSLGLAKSGIRIPAIKSFLLICKEVISAEPSILGKNNLRVIVFEGKNGIQIDFSRFKPVVLEIVSSRAVLAAIV